MEEMVLVFLFSSDYKSVWMIEKKRPSWQYGLLNGIGGHVEDGEISKDAALRELEEESGLKLDFLDLRHVGSMGSIGTRGNEEWNVEIFAGITDKKLISLTDETIMRIPVGDLHLWGCIDNIPSLVALCLLGITSRKPPFFKLQY